MSKAYNVFGVFLSALFLILLPACSTQIKPTCGNPNKKGSLEDFNVNRYDEPIMWRNEVFPLPVIISPDFSPDERLAIIQSIQHWNYDVGLVVFEPVFGITNSIISIPYAITITEHKLEKFCGNQILGLATRKWKRDFLGVPTHYYTSHIEIHSEHNFDSSYIRTVVHELGHALGLNHDEENIGSVMFPRILYGFWHIEKKDIEFVKLSMTMNNVSQ